MDTTLTAVEAYNDMSPTKDTLSDDQDGRQTHTALTFRSMTTRTHAASPTLFAALGQKVEQSFIDLAH